MKKFTVLIAVVLIAASLFCACEKKEEPVYLPIDTTCVLTGVRTSDGSIAYEDMAAYEIALAYNTITEYEAYDEEAEPIWEIAMMCTPSAQTEEGKDASVYKISYLGEGKLFNIDISGENGGRCKVVSEELYNAFAKPVQGE